MTWVKTAPISKLDRSPAVFKYSSRQISVFKVDNGVFAIDNRCPHEGYPLAEVPIHRGFYNRKRWHSLLGDLSPSDYESGLIRP